jgi:hypothetical protein
LSLVIDILGTNGCINEKSHPDIWCGENHENLIVCVTLNSKTTLPQTSTEK